MPGVCAYLAKKGFIIHRVCDMCMAWGSRNNSLIIYHSVYGVGDLLKMER